MKEKLLQIQQNLKAPKNQHNSFGNYNYRSCEDIFEAVKPLLKEQNLILTLNDELVQVGERYYIKATATLYDIETDDETCITNTAYAREEETKKGMDGSQITGASSSYARKYALNGLFLIDDVKDSDTTNGGNEPTEEDAKNYEFTFGKNKGRRLLDVIEENGDYIDWLIRNSNDTYLLKCIELLTGIVKPSDEELQDRLKLIVEFKNLLMQTETDNEKLYEHYGVETMDDMTNEQLLDAINVMKKKVK